MSLRFSALATAAALALLPVLCLSRLANAQTVHDNGAPDNINGYFSDPGSDAFIAETFTFAVPTTFNTVQWFGTYAFTNTPPATDNFTISFYNATGGQPDPTALPDLTFTVANNVNRTPTGDTVVGFTGFSYSTLLPSVVLGAGTYGISIVNDTAADADDNWAWLTSAQTGTHYQRSSPTGSFVRLNSDLAFRLGNTATAIPEPGSIALMGTGSVLPLAAAAMARRRRRASTAA